MAATLTGSIRWRTCSCRSRPSASRMPPSTSWRMRRLVAPGLLPERAGQPLKGWVHISLADLMVLDGSSALLEEWTRQVRAQWAGQRAQASAGGGDGGAWPDGDAGGAVACDAAMVPFVTGEVNPAALEDLVRLCVELDRLRHHPHTGPRRSKQRRNQRHLRRPCNGSATPTASPPPAAYADGEISVAKPQPRG